MMSLCSGARVCFVRHRGAVGSPIFQGQKIGRLCVLSPVRDQFQLLDHAARAGGLVAS